MQKVIETINLTYKLNRDNIQTKWIMANSHPFDVALKNNLLSDSR